MNEQLGDSTIAVRIRLDALAATERLVELEPGNPAYVKALVSTAVSVAAVQMDSRSTAHLVRVEPLLRQFVEMEPEDHDRQCDEASFYLGLSGAYLAVDDLENAERHTSRALDVLHSLPSTANNNPDQIRLVLTASTRSSILAHGRDDAEARSVFGAEAAGAADHLEEKLGTDATTLISLADLWARCEVAELCDPERAESLARRAIELSHDAIPRSYYTLALAVHAQAKAEDVRDAARHALALLPQDDRTLRLVVEQFLTGTNAAISDAPQGAKAVKGYLPDSTAP